MIRFPPSGRKPYLPAGFSFSIMKNPAPPYAQSATLNSVNPAIRLEHEWTGKHGRQYRSFRLWLTEGWSQPFLQVLTIMGWETLY